MSIFELILPCHFATEILMKIQKLNIKSGKKVAILDYMELISSNLTISSPILQDSVNLQHSKIFPRFMMYFLVFRVMRTSEEFVLSICTPRFVIYQVKPLAIISSHYYYNSFSHYRHLCIYNAQCAVVAFPESRLRPGTDISSILSVMFHHQRQTAKIE